ncbi:MULTISPECIES: alpha/beta hydrolase [unclassified Oceanispirochaeta]|uniref:alpha/beta hydrolase n=1 Tax=unclassified Oceanispirochaeta TaxID=2635722 RepID=UPI000E08D893|nr:MULTISPECIES: alpha/beta hydrolase [unclassified Oceanispirochaeta]MBF9014465.1 alpha/beta hydrolase [Oceanispirochaeta sp. M2]NPD70721.1 alpha/beta hydrolase [Oceanispirochaeta sp. M1]RDG34005.1 alpha/beta hydrolase [Oceanispirochaeta sp. M1]
MNNIKRLFLFTMLLAAISCTTVKSNQIVKMPPPAVMDDEQYNPFLHGAVIQDRHRVPLLYATNRYPATEDDREPYYLSRRSELVRLGIAGIGVAEEGKTWDDMTMIEASRSSKKKALLEVTDVEEFGILDSSASPFTSQEFREDISDTAKERFLLELRSQLKQTESKDVVVFVHGYNVNFENPLLMTAQLWHYFGYRGSFISYGWPATPQNTAYFKDLDTAAFSARSFRVFLDFLAEQEEVEQIHILGYSAGTRLVTNALYQKALQMSEIPAKEAQLKTKLGTVILSNSDLDRALFGSYLIDGQLNIMKRMNLYSSSKDMVLVGSMALHLAPRMGQTIVESEIDPPIREFFNQNDKINLIDVSNAEHVSSNGGHFYFLESPWVSSDVLFSLLTGLGPEDRGLVPHPDLPLYVFPPDYVERSRKLMDRLNTDFRNK